MENSGRKGTELKERHRLGKLCGQNMLGAITCLFSFLDMHSSLSGGF